jgi:hypothetical protein
MLGIARYYDTARYCSVCSVLLGMLYFALIVALSVVKNDMPVTERTQSCYGELQSSQHCT